MQLITLLVVVILTSSSVFANPANTIGSMFLMNDPRVANNRLLVGGRPFTWGKERYTVLGGRERTVLPPRENPVLIGNLGQDKYMFIPGTQVVQSDSPYGDKDRKHKKYKKHKKHKKHHKHHHNK